MTYIPLNPEDRAWPSFEATPAFSRNRFLKETQVLPADPRWIKAWWDKRITSQRYHPSHFGFLTILSGGIGVGYINPGEATYIPLYQCFTYQDKHTFLTALGSSELGKSSYAHAEILKLTTMWYRPTVENRDSLAWGALFHDIEFNNSITLKTKRGLFFAFLERVYDLHTRTHA